MGDLANNQLLRRWNASEILIGPDRVEEPRSIKQVTASRRPSCNIALLPLRLASRFDGGQWSNLRVQLADDLPPASEIVDEHKSEVVTEVLKVCRGQSHKDAIFRGMDHSICFQAACEKRGLECPSAERIVNAVRAMVRMLRLAIPETTGHALYIFLILRQLPHFPSRDTGRIFLFTVWAVRAFPLLADPITALVSRGPNALFMQERWRRKVWAPHFSGFSGAEYGAVPPMRLSLDASGHIQDVSHLNFFAVIEGTLHTPPISDQTYPGITRRSIMRIARFLGMDVIEEPMQIADFLGAIALGKVSEAFVTGVVCMVWPVGALKDESGTEYRVSNAEGTLTKMFRKMLLDIQEGRLPDEFDWMQTV